LGAVLHDLVRVRVRVRVGARVRARVRVRVRQSCSGRPRVAAGSSGSSEVRRAAVSAISAMEYAHLGSRPNPPPKVDTLRSPSSSPPFRSFHS
jgi:hypothetical protein